MRRWFVKILIFTCCCFSVHLYAAERQTRFSSIEHEIDCYNLESAKVKIKKLSKKEKESANGKYVQGKFQFFMGNYQESITLLKEAIEKSKTQLDWKYLRDQVVTSNAQRNGLTRIRAKNITFYFHGKMDKILVAYAVETLNAQQKALEKEFGFRLNTLNVYLLPSSEALSLLSGLSVEQIESTGTVGVSKYNRIMVLSPKVLVNGYPWRDTLAHELTHLYITRASQNKAPIWLHEGISKMLEGRWRNEPVVGLTPTQAYLLDSAVREKRIIPLRGFHPSVSLLPSQEDAALAYAQGLSFCTYIMSQLKREKTLNTFLKTIAKKGVNEAFSENTTSSLKKLFTWWQEELRAIRQAPASLVPLMKRKFQTSYSTPKYGFAGALPKEVQNHIRIGDLLRMRGHVKAAEKEYKWALEKNKVVVPAISDRLSETLLALKKPKDAMKILKATVKKYPHHVTAYIQLGHANRVLQKTDAAEQYFVNSIGFNPYIGDVHCSLSKLYLDIGKIQKSKNAKENCLFLSAK